MEWNIILIPVLMGNCIIGHWNILVQIKNLLFFKNWKEKQIQKYMEE